MVYALRLAARIIAIVTIGNRLRAQEGLERALAGERAASEQRRQIREAPASIRLGDARIQVGGSVNLEWNDSITFSDADSQADVIVSPSLGLNAIYPVGLHNMVQFSADVSYQRYMSHPELNHWSVAPGSEVSADVFVGDVRLNLHERFAYQQDVRNVGAVSGAATYGGFDNSIGASATLLLDHLMTSVGYDYTQFISATPQYKSNDRISHNVVARGGWSVHPSAILGVEVSGGPTDYAEAYLNDSFSVSAGSYVDWAVSPYIQVTPRAGYTIYKFQSNPVFGAPADFGAYYIDVQMHHRVNHRLTYTLSGGRAISAGINSNVEELWHANLAPSFLLFEGVNASAGLFYERGHETAGPIDQEFERVGAGVALTYQLFAKVNAGVGYDYTVKVSNRAGYDYTQNRVHLSLSWTF